MYYDIIMTYYANWIHRFSMFFIFQFYSVLMAHYRSVQDWWPLPPQEVASSVTKMKHAGLFVRGCLRKRRARKQVVDKAGPKAKAKKASAKKAAKKGSKKV